jgi:hypothetical protein
MMKSGILDHFLFCLHVGASCTSLARQLVDPCKPSHVFFFSSLSKPDNHLIVEIKTRVYSCWDQPVALTICDMFQPIQGIIKVLGLVQVEVSKAILMLIGVCALTWKFC